MSICSLAQVGIVNKPVDFRGNTMQLKDVNSTGHIPMIEEGLDKIFGGNNLIYIYLCKKHPKLEKLMLPSG